MQSPQAEARKWNLWPVCLIGFFSVAIVSCAGFVAFCSLHPAELVTPDYYEQEMRYQAQMSRMENARQLEHAATITYDAIAKMIIVTLPTPDASLHPTGTIQLYRPSAAGLDRNFRLVLDPRGLQRIDAHSLVPGLWKVRVSWTVATREYYLDRAVVIPSPAA